MLSNLERLLISVTDQFFGFCLVLVASGTSHIQPSHMPCHPSTTDPFAATGQTRE
jgi:hypothetical protein